MPDSLDRMHIRPATDADWPRVFPFYRAIVDAGRTYALPAGQSLEEARPNWMAEAPARTFVAVDDGTVLGSAKAGPNRPGAARTSPPGRSSWIPRTAAAASAARSAST
ncbi:hypothetical protein BC477_17605 [Clavibacter michiganensis subsp. michiganensis]|uniref:Acetyltransferase n=1 Tax=Clavibacter michiganensis subsp. michiganensis TaxID=33013 RepID=A0A251XDI2_CLAMM|nr:hypothetical protein BC477_17605 [Clavibacter michiganensis subsp. michiganensis]OUE00277.1 hypothetical protein CMMCAS07_17900 [Clavibacter michiganensis subsp. michiganensis]